MNKTILMRDELGDIGTIHSKSYFWSPDIVLHDRMEDPESFLSWSYKQDVSQPLPPQGGDVLVYVRAKNVGKASEKVYIHLYAAKSSEFTQIEVWKQKKLMTESGQKYVCISSLSPQDIGVGAVPFVFHAGKEENYSLIACATDSEADPLASVKRFTDYADFAFWVRENPGVCMRTLDIVKTEFLLEDKCKCSFRFHTFEQVMRFSFRIEINESFPQGTDFIFSSPFFKTERFQLQKDYQAYSKEIEGVEQLPDFYGNIDIELTLPTILSIHGEGMISVIAGVRDGAEFYPIGRSSVKFIRGI